MAYVPPHRRARAATDQAATRPASKPVPSWRAPSSLQCGCGRNGTRFCIYSDGHALASKSPSESEVLGGFPQFCASFFHIEPTPEAGVGELCLGAACGELACPRKTVVGVARLQQQLEPIGTEIPGWKDVYTARYFNCWQGGSEANLHAETFLLKDKGLQAAMAALPLQEAGVDGADGAHGRADATKGAADAAPAGGSATVAPVRGRLLLYLTYQPCHHSGGHKKRGMGEHGTSCTELLLRHVADVLRPARVQLVIRLPYLYRAHWETGGYDRKYAPAVLAARRGLELLANEPGIELASFAPGDWDWLVAHCDAQVRTAWREGKPPFNAAALEARARMDAFVAAKLAEYARAPAPAPSLAPVDAADGTTVPADATSPGNDDAEVAGAARGLDALSFEVCTEIT